LAKHQVKTMTVAVKVFRMKVTAVFIDSLLEYPPWKVFHYLGEDIFASVHNFGLFKAQNYLMLTSNRKMSKNYINYLKLMTCNDVESKYRIGKRFKS